MHIFRPHVLHLLACRFRSFGLAPFLTASLFFVIACQRQKENKETPSQRQSAVRATWVGSEACASCHPNIYASFRETGMGRSFSLPEAAKLATIAPFDKTVYEPRTNFYYSIHALDGKVVMREFRRENGKITHEQERVAAYQVGSGNHTISFLEARNGYLYEMPLTWYSHKKIWDMSPGYLENNWRFDRPINSTCLNCHTGPSRRSPQTENHYEKVQIGIGCENCHGPGSAHVETALAKPPSQADHAATIVNPIDLDRQTQMDICQRCHLEGLRTWHDGLEADQWEVGKPLAAQQSVFVISSAHANEAEFGIAAQADRLMKSACYQKSGSMTCTTCHDPHQSPKRAGVAHFNETCRSCHAGVEAQTMCSVQLKPGENAEDCVRCHMKVGETSDIPHVRFTDHFIRRNINEKRQTNGSAIPSAPFLIPLAVDEKPAARKLQTGLAYFQYHQVNNAGSAYLDSTIFYLEEAARNDATRQDGEEEYALGSAYFLQGKAEQAEAALRRAVRKNSKHARAYYALGRVLLHLERAEEADQVFSLGVLAQPKLLENSLGLADAKIVKADPEGALNALESVIAQDSLSYPEAYYKLGQLWHKLGDYPRARKFYGKVVQLSPDMTLARLNIGATYVLEEKWQPALRSFDAILHSNPEYVPALFNKTVCLAKLGQVSNAKRLAKKVLALEPENENAKRLLQELEAM